MRRRGNFHLVSDPCHGHAGAMWRRGGAVRVRRGVAALVAAKKTTYPVQRNRAEVTQYMGACAAKVI